LGGDIEHRKDQVTIYLRAVSVENGRILKSVSTTKTILSREIHLGIFRFVSLQRLLEVETGLTRNEPPQMCVLEAIEKAVLSLIIEGILDGIWTLKNPEDINSPVIQSYLEEKGAVGKVEEEDPEEKRKSLKVQIGELYQKGLVHKRDGEYEKARECFEQVINKSQMYEFSDHLKSAERELANVEKLEKNKERVLYAESAKSEEKKGILALGLGNWFLSGNNNSFTIYEAQLRLRGSLRLFGGGGETPDESSHIGYFGARIGDKLNVGIGGMNSNVLEKSELMYIGGLSLGTDKVRLEGSYFYVPENDDANGIRALLQLRL